MVTELDLSGEGDSWRTAAQNRYQWPILAAWAKQKQWPINGQMCFLSREEWKDVLTATYEGEVMPRLCPKLDHTGMVMLGRRTSKYGKKKFAEWIEWLNAASAMSGIRIPAPERMAA